MNNRTKKKTKLNQAFAKDKQYSMIQFIRKSSITATKSTKTHT